MTRGLCVLLLLVGLAACGSPERGTLPTQVVSSDGSATPGSQIVPITNDAQAAPARMNCGEMTMAGNPPRALDNAETVRAAAACFVKAYASCTPAALTIRERDTKIVRQFTVEPDAKCIVRQALQPDPNSPPAVVDCTAVRAEKSGLVITACSHLGDFVLIPMN
ncbi:MAG: hypothetical protein HY741_08560 [Chloroflexi bacterium]|nr:hypothetical protein [Chloroflexota bacterium]